VLDPIRASSERARELVARARRRVRRSPGYRSFRRAGKRAVTRLGWMPAYTAYRESKRPYLQRRDNQDMRNLNLLMRYWLQPDACCVDIGANHGDVLAEIVEVAPRGHHMAFEPLPHLAAELRAKFPDVDVREVALADRRGREDYVFVPAADAYSGLFTQEYPYPWSTESLTVDVDRLDDCIPAGYVPDFIKIDVEGAEAEVLAGAIDTIRRARPLVVFEHYQGGAGSQGSGPADLFGLLTAAGMQVIDIDGEGPYTLEEMEEAFASRRMWTWVARPLPRSGTGAARE
jgi:FkbM family methyltransferase